MKQFPPHFELIHFAFKKAYGIDFINTQNINGVTPAQAYLRLWEIAHDPLETVVEYWYGVNQKLDDIFVFISLFLFVK